MIGRIQTELPSMLALARTHTDEARVELAGKLADIFLSADVVLSLREEELLNELMDQLLHSKAASVRAQLVKRFAKSTRMPHKMAVSLACDSIDVASDILKTSTCLADDDLIMVVQTQTVDHAKAVAQRAAIAEAVADALVTTGSIEVMQLVASNLGAHLSPRAVEVLSQAARFNSELREPTLNRPEMTSDVALKLYWWVPQDLRRAALAKFEISAGQLDESLAKTIDELLGYHTLEKNNDDVMAQVADWLSERQGISIHILPQILRLGHFRLFNMLLGRLANLSLSLVDTIVTESGGRGLAVLCRAVGIDKPGFVSIFLLSRGSRADEHIVHPRELSHALAAFDRMTQIIAQDLLNTWKIDPSYFSQRRQHDAVIEA